MQSKVDICFLPLSFVVSHAYIFNKYQNTVLFTFWKEALAAPFCLCRLESAAIHKKCSDWLKFPSRCPAGDWTWTVSKPLHNPTAAHVFNFRTPLRCSNGDPQEIEYILCPNLVQPNVLRTGSISEFPFHSAPTNLMFWWAIMRYCHTNTTSYIIVSILQMSHNKLTKGEGRKMSLNPVYCTPKSWG